VGIPTVEASGVNTPPYWTAADQAELDVLVCAFVDAAWTHGERCVTCKTGGWCEPLREGLDLVLEWRRRRLLHSEAAYLRAAQDLAEGRPAA
jgi:hypothetical protein